MFLDYIFICCGRKADIVYLCRYIKRTVQRRLFVRNLGTDYLFYMCRSRLLDSSYTIYGSSPADHLHHLGIGSLLHHYYLVLCFQHRLHPRLPDCVVECETSTATATTSSISTCGTRTTILDRFHRFHYIGQPRRRHRDYMFVQYHQLRQCLVPTPVGASSCAASIGLVPAPPPSTGAKCSCSSGYTACSTCTTITVSGILGHLRRLLGIFNVSPRTRTLFAWVSHHHHLRHLRGYYYIHHHLHHHLCITWVRRYTFVTVSVAPVSRVKLEYSACPVTGVKCHLLLLWQF